MNKSELPYYKKTWFSDRHSSLLNLVFNIVEPPKGMLESSQPNPPTFYPTLFSIYVVDGLTILILLQLITHGYVPLGCKTEFLERDEKYWAYSQIAMLYVIYAFIAEPYAQNLKTYGEVLPPLWTFAITVTVWALANMTARLGDEWALKDSILWFTPLTLWGVIGISLTIMYVCNEYYNYYYSQNPNSATTMVLEYVNMLGYGTIMCTILYKFFRALYYKVIMGNDSLVSFFFKLDIFDCVMDKKTVKKYDNEIKAK